MLGKASDPNQLLLQPALGSEGLDQEDLAASAIPLSGVTQDREGWLEIPLNAGPA